MSAAILNLIIAAFTSAPQIIAEAEAAYASIKDTLSETDVAKVEAARVAATAAGKAADAALQAVPDDPA